VFRFVFLAMALPLGSFADVRKEEPGCPDGKQHYRTAIRHIESGGIGYENGYTTLEAFFASDPSHWVVTPFLDGRAHIFDNGKWAANVGIGVRALWGNRAYGINSYYDYRNAGRFHANQIGLGLETLGQLFDFRINGYLPVGTKTSSPYDIAFGFFSGHYMFLSQKVQSAMKGADAEFGFHFGKSKSCDFYTAVGPYYFIGEAAPATWGGKARIAGTFKDLLTLEISDSYDRTFHNNLQGQIALSFSFGPKSKVKERGRTCKIANILNDRMLQPVNRQEIIVVDNAPQNTLAINPTTGLPYFFVFVDNTSSSNGTYESPYHSFAQAQANSSPNDIIYVFPGDGTTTGMNAGIALQASQKLWGSGVSHPIQTTEGTVSIPAQSSSSPTITNTDIDTDGDAVVLAANNAVSGFTIVSTLRDGINGEGIDPQSLEVSSCTFNSATRFTITAIFSGNTSVSITNNRFLDNTNGIFLTLQGTSTVVCSDNVFQGQTSPSSIPLTIVADNNAFTAQVKNNLFDSNTVGAIQFTFKHNVLNADISVLNNTITNNGVGSAGSGLGSSLVLNPDLDDTTIANCTIVLKDNTFSNNTTANSLYVHSTGIFTNCDITASTNTMSHNASALVFASRCTTFNLNATNNTLTHLTDHGIVIEGDSSFTTANITINQNTITDISGGQNGISLSKGSSTLYFTAENNTISECTGSGIVCFVSPAEFTNMTTNITGNVISGCQNLSSNGASGISLDSYHSLTATLANNSLSGNANPGVGVGLGFDSGDLDVCLTLTGNSSNTDPGYSLKNPGSGAFDLSPCNVDTVNTGTIAESGSFTLVQSCPAAVPCS
jgi:hypothetical protein